MKFEVRYPNGSVHEVSLEGTLAVLGRDPSCDLVLSDGKCSRRHAVIEAGPDGLAVRDSGSANGIYVNGKRVDRAPLAPGDEVRLGEVIVKVLEEEMPGTLVMGPDEVADLTAPPVPPPVSTKQPTDRGTVLPPAAPAPPARPATPPASGLPRTPSGAAPAAGGLPRRSGAAPPPPPPPLPPPPPARREPPRGAVGPRGGPGPAEPLPRPLTSMFLAALWLLSVFGYLALAAAALWMGRTLEYGTALVIAGVLLAGVSLVLGVGIWLRAPWGRLLQLAAAAIGLLTCVFTPLSGVALAYMLHPATRIVFSGRTTFRELSEQEAQVVRKGVNEPLYAGGLVVSLFVGLFLAGLVAVFAIPALARR
jgi:pSer/pThr/pTyr-binding forkhead associated (FHA) protein